MAFNDLRDWISSLEKQGELSRVKVKVDWDLEMGGILQEVQEKEGPALLFDNIKDHEGTLCRKLFTGSLLTYPRIALMMGLPKDTSPRQIIETYMQRIKNPIKPVVVKDGPVKQNILTGKDINLFEFPTPKWHHRDGGRFIGTCDGVVSRDPETGIMNVGLYRSQILDKNHMGVVFMHGQHIWLHWRKHKNLGKRAIPIAIAIGWDPVLPMIACAPIPSGVCEYDIMGGLRGKAVELVKCETNDLEVPANAEIVFEGEIPFDVSTFMMEGPFGEYTGYYASLPSAKPAMTVNCITYRNDPILQGIMEGVPINEDHRMESINNSACVWQELKRQMWGITGVDVHPSTGYANLFVQIDNSYIGQVHQAAAAIWGMGLSNQVGKNIMVVDQDIDIFDLDKLAWAFAYRVNPKTDIIEYPGWISPLDPITHPKDRVGVTVQPGTRLLIDATKSILAPRTEQYSGERFAPVCYPDEETMKLVRKRWKEYNIQVSKTKVLSEAE